MKATLFSVLVALTACGPVANDGATIAANNELGDTSTKYSTTMIQGNVISVETRLHTGDAGDGTHPPALGWTETVVKVGFQVPCTARLASVTHDVRKHVLHGGNVRAHVAVAATLLDKTTFGPQCQAIALETREIVLSGSLDQASVDVEFLKGTPATVKAPIYFDGTVDALTADMIEVDAIASLCQPGAKCKQDGTKMSLTLTGLSCVDAVGPLAVKVVSIDNNGHAKLQLAGTVMRSNALVACAAIVRKVPVTLPEQKFTTAELTVLGE